MRKLFLIGACLSVVQLVQAQDLPDYAASNYSGVNGVFFNPANIADSRYKFDINLVSVSTFVGNDQAAFKLRNLGQSFKGDSLRNQVFGRNAGPTSGLISTVVNGPSFMFNVGKKNTIAITTRARMVANIVDLDGKLVEKVMDDVANDPALPYSINSQQNMRMSLNGWSEFGVSFGRILYQSGNHFLKGGVTLKYLGGAGSTYINIDNFQATIDADVVAQDAYLRNATGRIGVAKAGLNYSDFEVGNLLKPEGAGIGADLGFVYEYRPASSNTGRDDNKYKVKVGLALLDMGSIKYDKEQASSGTYNIDITGGERLYFRDIDNLDLEDYNAFFRSRPQFFAPDASNNETSFKASLPTTLRLDVDYHVKKGFYISGAGVISVVSKSSKPSNAMYYSSFAVTPRLEGKILGIYLPIAYNELTKFNAGLSVRVGPLYFGSGSVISALMGDSKQADVHVGLRFGVLHKR